MWDWLARRYDAFIASDEAEKYDPWRKELLTDTGGQTCLEIGAGTGSSIGCWPSNLKRLVQLEPSTSMRIQLVAKVEAGETAGTPVYPIKPEIINIGLGGVYSLPFEDNTFDNVLASLVLCGVPGATEPLKEIRRVLKDGGTLHFIEHVKPDGWFSWLFCLILSPLWRLVFLLLLDQGHASPHRGRLRRSQI